MSLKPIVPAASPTKGVSPCRPSPEQLAGHSTPWDLLRQAHDAPPEVRQAAMAELAERYGTLIRRYFGGVFRGRPDQRDAVDECVQRFGLRLTQGGFGGADPGRGRFRDYLKTSLCRLAVDYLREKTATIGGDIPDAAAPDGDFDEMHRMHLVQRALLALERQGQQFHAVLRLRMAQPEWTMERLAEALSRGGEPRNANWVKQQLFRGRERLCAQVRAEVASELRSARPEDIDDELAALGLLEYVRR